VFFFSENKRRRNSVIFAETLKKRVVDITRDRVAAKETAKKTAKKAVKKTVKTVKTIAKTIKTPAKNAL